MPGYTAIYALGAIAYRILGLYLRNDLRNLRNQQMLLDPYRIVGPCGAGYTTNLAMLTVLLVLLVKLAGICSWHKLGCVKSRPGTFVGTPLVGTS